MSRYKYELDPKAKNRLYNINEYIWNTQSKSLDFVADYKLTGKEVKYWFGSTPRNMIFKRPMWIYLPDSIHKIVSEDRKLLEHFLNFKNPPLIPFSIDTLRYYAPENLVLSDQVKIVPSRFKNLVYK